MAQQAIRTSKCCLYVKRGSAGLSLFTKEPIRKGAFVSEFHGPILTNKEADKKGGKYLFEVNSRWTIDGTERDNIARYFNHSCVPNCESEARGKRIFMYAKRAVKPREELTLNYGKEYFERIIKPNGCKCAKCR